MQELRINTSFWPWIASCMVVAAVMLTAIVAVAFVVPTETTMGDAQRILYIHVPVAWLGLLAFAIMAGAGVLYLLKRDLCWDHWAHAAAELGWLFCGLTLITGSLWAHAAWATWWAWDPRLTTSFILWLIYSGCLVVRGSIHDAHRRARISAVLACIGALDIPLVIMATRWFRGIHPVSPEMEPSMRVVLALCAVSFTAFFVMLLSRRRVQMHFDELLGDLRQQAEASHLPVSNADTCLRNTTFK